MDKLVVVDNDVPDDELLLLPPPDDDDVEVSWDVIAFSDRLKADLLILLSDAEEDDVPDLQPLFLDEGEVPAEMEVGQAAPVTSRRGRVLRRPTHLQDFVD